MAAKIQILSNTNYPLVNVLNSELAKSVNVQIAVAFLRRAGIDELRDSLDTALKQNNAKIEIIVGLDFKTTDADALSILSELKKSHNNFNFLCYGDKQKNYTELVFHPKIYMFETQSKSGVQRYTSVVGSSNLTRGGLTTNFEVNSIFQEDTPKYFSQLQAIYNEIKYTDSIFVPNKKYIEQYGQIKKKLDKSDSHSTKNIQVEIQKLKNEEQQLPGTVPSLKKVIIEFMEQQEKGGVKEIALEQIYEFVPMMIEERHMNMKMDTIDNSIRGELNKHEIESKHKDGRQLFKRVGSGIYTLTDKARNYEGR